MHWRAPEWCLFILLVYNVVHLYKRIHPSTHLSVGPSITRFPKSPQNPWFWSLMISEWMGEDPGTLSIHTHTHARANIHKRAAKIAEKRPTDAAQQHKGQMYTITHTHMQIRCHNERRCACRGAAGRILRWAWPYFLTIFYLFQIFAKF